MVSHAGPKAWIDCGQVGVGIKLENAVIFVIKRAPFMSCIEQQRELAGFNRVALYPVDNFALLGRFTLFGRIAVALATAPVT